MKKIFRLRNILFALLALLLSPVVLFFGLYAYSVVSANYICSVGAIRSDADAAELAKSLFFQAKYAPHDVPRMLDKMPNRVEWDQAASCCRVVRSTDWQGMIVWKVHATGKTIGEPIVRAVDLDIHFSNCGLVFQAESFLSASPFDQK